MLWEHYKFKLLKHVRPLHKKNKHCEPLQSGDAPLRQAAPHFAHHSHYDRATSGDARDPTDMSNVEGEAGKMPGRGSAARGSMTEKDDAEVAAFV